MKQPEASPEEPRNLEQRLLAITADIGHVEKAGKAPSEMGGFAYIKADDVATAVRGQLVKHGVLSTWTVASQSTQQITFQTKSGPRSNFFTEVELDVTFANVDKPEETLTVKTFGHGIDSSDKAPGKGITYALKSLYIAMFHLKGQIDNEAEDVGEAVPAKEPVTEQEVVDFDFAIHCATDMEKLRTIAEDIRKRGVSGKDRDKLMAAWKDKAEEIKGE